LGIRVLPYCTSLYVFYVVLPYVTLRKIMLPYTLIIWIHPYLTSTFLYVDKLT